MAQNDNVVFKTSTTATIDDLFSWNKSTGQIAAKTDNIPIVPGTVYFTADGHIVHDLAQNNRLWMSKNAYSAIYAEDVAETNTDIANAIKYSIHYVEGPTTDTTAGTWTGTINGITELYDGLTIIYVPAVDGSSTTTLNINGLGAKTCYYNNTSTITTHYSVGTPILLTYRNNRWRRADYNNNTTYSAMSVAEMRAGTATSLRTIRADYLKTFLSTLGGTNLTLTHSKSEPYLQLNHDPSGITAGTYGNNSQQNPSYGGTFNIPYFTVDTQGHITNASVTTVKLPASDNTDYKVRQTPINSNDNNNYRILLSNSANDTSEDSVSKKNANLIYNPAENKLSTGNLDLTGNINVVGDATFNNTTTIDNAILNSLLVSGNSSFVNNVNFTQIPTAPTATAGTSTTQIATTEFVTNAVAQGFIANDAMVFKGLIGSNQPITQLPTSGYNAGWTYRVADAGIFAGEYCEVGDLLIAINDGPASGSSVINTDWGKVEHNIDGAVFRGSGASNSSVGSSTQPIYVNGSGIVTAITGALANDITGNAATATTASKLSNTSKIGDTNKPVYFKADGTPAAINYTIDKAVPSNAVFTDRYINSATFADDSTNTAASPVKMTLTRAGSDTATVTASIPKVSSSSAGVAPKGAAVSSQNQSTKFLREDGTWAAPSYTVNTNTDTLVKQTAKSDNKNYKILFTTSGSPTSGNANEAAYDTDITINPSTHTLTATKFIGSLQGNAATATTASKLSNTSAIGSSTQPVYFNSSGQPVAVNKYDQQTGKTTDFVPHVRSDGVMEIGKYIDFHNTSEDTSGYIVRITARDSSETNGAGLTLTDTTVGTFKGNLNGTATKATQDGNGNNIINTYLTKTAGVTNITWDNTNKKLIKTINNSNSDIVTLYAANLKLNNTAVYNTELEIKNIKIGNGSTSTSTKNVKLEYNETLETLNFVFS